MATGTRRTRKTTAKHIDPGKGISGDYSDVPEREGGDIYDGPQPTPGLYPATLSSVGQHTTSDDAVVWTFDITDGKYAGWRGWVYTNSDAAKWKQQDILVALGLMEKGGSVSLSYDEILRKAGPVRVRVISETYQEEARAKIKTVMAPAEPADTADDDDDDDPDFQDEPDKPTRAAARKAKGTKEAEPEADDGEGGDERDERAEELAMLSLVQLKKAAKEAGLTLADYRGKKAEEIIDLILVEEFGDAEDDEGDDDEGIDLDALEEELGDMNASQLKAKAKEFGLKLADYRGKSDDDLVNMILDAAEEQNPEF